MIGRGAILSASLLAAVAEQPAPRLTGGDNAHDEARRPRRVFNAFGDPFAELPRHAPAPEEPAR